MKLNTPTRMATTFAVRSGEEGTRTLTFQIATERVALDRGIVAADGADFSRYMGDSGNPIVLLGHDHGEPFGHTTRIARNANGWEADVEVAPDDELSPAGQRWFKRLRRLGRGAASIGFTVDESRAPSEAERKAYGDKLEWIGTRWTLLEWSIVAVPADPGALMHSGTDEGRAFRRAMSDAGFERLMEDEAQNDQPGQTARADAPAGEAPASGGTTLEAVMATLAAIETKLDQVVEIVSADAAEDVVEEPSAAPDIQQNHAKVEALRAALADLTSALKR